MISRPVIPAYVLWLGLTGLSIVRALGRNGIPVIALHDDPGEPSTLTRYARVHFLPSVVQHEHEWLDFLVREGRSCAPVRPVLFVAADLHWLFVVRHREVLIQYFRFSYPGAPDHDQWMNKAFQIAAAHRVGIRSPGNHLPRTIDEVRRLAPTLQYPCLIKPTTSDPWRTIYRTKLAFAGCAAELIRRCDDALKLGLEFMVQEYVPAEDHDCYLLHSYLDRNGECLAAVASRKHRQYPPRFGSSCFSESVDRPDVIAAGLKVLRSMKYHGISGVEFKQDPRDGGLKLMEVNLRAGMFLATTIDSGINIPLIAYRDLCEQPNPVPTSVRYGRKVGTLSDDFKTFRFYMALGQTTWSRWIWSWLHARDLAFAWDDLRPFHSTLWGILDKWTRGEYSGSPWLVSPSEWRAGQYQGMVNAEPMTEAKQPVDRRGLKRAER